MIKLDLNDRDLFNKFFQSLNVEFFDGQEASEKLEYESTRINNFKDLMDKVKVLIKKHYGDRGLEKYEFFLT